MIITKDNLVVSCTDTMGLITVLIAPYSDMMRVVDIFCISLDLSDKE